MKLMSSIYMALIVFYSSSSFGITECTGNIQKMYIGDTEAIWLFLDTGGAAKLLKENVNQKNIYSAALSAYMAGKQVTVRYSSDNADCSASNSDVRGLWLK